MNADTITLPLADVRALVQLGWELTNHISETDKSATGSIYGIEHAHKTIAKVAVLVPREPTVGTLEWEMANVPSTTPEREIAKLREENRALRKMAADDSWSKELQDAIDAIPLRFLGNDYWVEGIRRMAAELDRPVPARAVAFDKHPNFPE